MPAPDADTDVRYQRAIDALTGLSVGDAFGSRFFGSVETTVEMVRQRQLPERQRWFVTDDTWMALSIVEILGRHGRIDQDDLARSFGAHYQMDRGYGPAMHTLLDRFRCEKQWRVPARQQFNGSGSFGNGGAMRVAPVGAYFADDIERAAEQAKLSAEVTHAHPEGIAGGIAIAVAAALAWQTRGTQPDPADFIEQVAQQTPADTDVTAGLRVATTLDADHSVPHVAQVLGSGYRITAQDTVPYCVWIAAHHLGDYETGLWQTVLGLGDIDTTCAMVGGILATRLGRDAVPAEWLSRREDLPAWAFTR